MRQILISILLPLTITGCQATATTEPHNEQSKASSITQADEVSKISKSNVYTEKQPIITAQPSAQHATTPLNKAKNNLKVLTENISCDNTEQCHILAVGSRACGGPSSYITYSSKFADTAQVQKIAKQITSLEREYNAKNSMMSICQHLIQPVAQCVANKCVKVKANEHASY